FTTDDLPQMEHYQAMGHFRGIPAIHATLGEIAAGKKPGRQTEKERTIAANIGVAMADMATAVLVHRRAVERGLGRRLPL
ncbi:MAG TPA: ornithine cyclodeaminase family protein, partial [Anaerolineae bacterium]|nr:ornithine cyclodeaminase family protein [Anaerolineae bacterium]